MSQVFKMLLKRPQEMHLDVFQIRDETLILVLYEHVLHASLEACWWIRQAKGDPDPLV